MALAPKSWAGPAMHRDVHTGGENPFLLSCWTTCLRKFPLPGVFSDSGPGLTQTSEALHAHSNVQGRITDTGWGTLRPLWGVCARRVEEGWVTSCLRSNPICGKANSLDSEEEPAPSASAPGYLVRPRSDIYLLKDRPNQCFQLGILGTLSPPLQKVPQKRRGKGGKGQVL